MNPYICDCGNEKQDSQAVCDECSKPKPPSKPVIPDEKPIGPRRKKATRGRKVQVMLTDAEYEHLLKLSEKHSMSLSDYLARRVWPRRRS